MSIEPKRKAGRKLGTKNKKMESVFDIVLHAFKKIGGNKAMARWAKDNPDEFYTKMLIRALPKDVNIEAGETLEALIMKSFDRPGKAKDSKGGKP